MPMESKAQNRFIQWKKAQGVPWAKKFVAESQHGPGSMSSLPERVGELAKRRKAKGLS